MKKAKKIFSRIMTVISVALFIFGVVVFVSVLNASAGKVPSVFGFSVLQVKTGSMLPDYEIGTIVITKNVDANDLQVGDVISFYSLDKDISGEVNTHRIERIEYGGDDNEVVIDVHKHAFNLFRPPLIQEMESETVEK
jgi:signal peptidase